MGVLTVKVIKATNLADKDFVGKTDPYVEITLEQDNMVRVFFFNVLFVCFVDFRESHVVPDLRSWFYVLTAAAAALVFWIVFCIARCMMYACEG